MEDACDGQAPTARTLPQGSPASPIFSAAPTPGSLPRRGYADDSKLAACGPCPERNVEILAEECRSVASWYELNGLALEWPKSEPRHLTRKRICGNPAVRLPPGCSSPTLGAKPHEEFLQWLGVRLDKKLSFKRHVQACATKATKTAQALRLLAGCARGAPAHLLRRATLACVTAEAWWMPGQARGQKTLADMVDRPLRTALRATLPVWRTFPNRLLHHSAGVPLAHLLLNDISRRTAIRMASLVSQHVLRRALRAARIDDPRQPHRLTRLACNTPANIERSRTPRGRFGIPRPLAPCPALDSRVPREERTPRFASWMAQKNPRDVWVFTDGSKQADGRTGGGWIAYCMGRVVTRGRAAYNPHTEVYDAEARALLAGVKATMELPIAARANELWAAGAARAWHSSSTRGGHAHAPSPSPPRPPSRARTPTSYGCLATRAYPGTRQRTGWRTRVRPSPPLPRTPPRTRAAGGGPGRHETRT